MVMRCTCAGAHHGEWHPRRFAGPGCLPRAAAPATLPNLFAGWRGWRSGLCWLFASIAPLVLIVAGIAFAAARSFHAFDLSVIVVGHVVALVEGAFLIRNEEEYRRRAVPATCALIVLGWLWLQAVFGFGSSSLGHRSERGRAWSARGRGQRKASVSGERQGVESGSSAQMAAQQQRP